MGVFAVVLVSVVSPAVPVEASDDVVVRVFRLEHAAVADVSAAIQPMLSDDGSLTVQPAKGRLTVRDRQDVMVRVANMIEGLDRKPLAFRLKVELFEGSGQATKEGQALQGGVRFKKMFPFRAYRDLGTAELGGVTGDEIAVDLAEGYRISMKVLDHQAEPTPFGIPAGVLRLDLRPLILERVNGSKVRRVLNTRVVLSPNQEVVIGAGETEDSDHGLVLVVKALPEG